MRPRVNIDVCICPLAMNNSCGDMSSGWMRSDFKLLKWVSLHLQEPTCTQLLNIQCHVYTQRCTTTNRRCKICASPQLLHMHIPLQPKMQTLISKDLSRTFSHEQGEEDLFSTGPCHQWWQTDIPFSPVVLGRSGGSSAFFLACMLERCTRSLPTNITKVCSM